MEETFKTIPGFSRYGISPTGRILSYSRGVIRKPYLDPKNGYYKITLYDDSGIVKCVEIHRLVAETYIPKPEGNENWQVNHKNHIKTDNRTVNLEWVSPKGNINYDWDCGTRSREQHKYKYTVYKDGEPIAEFNSLRDVAELVGTSYTRAWYCADMELTTSTGYDIEKLETK